MTPDILRYITSWLKRMETELRARDLALARFREAYPEEAQALDVLVFGIMNDAALQEKMRQKFDVPLETLCSKAPVLLTEKEVSEFLSEVGRNAWIN